MKRQAFVWSVIASAALVALALGPAAVMAQGDNYFEGFDNEAPPDWKLDGGWSTGNGFLNGREFGAAIYAGPAGWHDAHYRVRVRILDGTASFLFMNTGDVWYYLYLRTGDGVVEAQLYYTRLGEEFPAVLGEGTVKYSPNETSAAANGLPIEVVVQGREVLVDISGQRVIEYTSEDDRPGGTIGFDIFQESQIAVDEVEVEPIRTETPPPSEGPDLAIAGISLREVRQGSVIADLEIQIVNQGGGESKGVKLVVFDQDQPDVRVEIGVESLPPGGSRTVEASLRGPDDWANTERRFVAQIDPDNNLGETNRENNQLTSGTLFLNITSGGGGIPGGSSNPPSQGGPGSGFLPLVLGVLGVLGLGVVGGTALVIRNQAQIGQRKKLQKEAKEGKPPDHCTPPGRYVEVETEVELKLMKVTEVEVIVLDPASRATRHKETIKDKLPGDLNTAIRGRWLREPDEKLAARLNGLARDFSKAISTQAFRQKDLCDVVVTAHLEGIELKSTFTLYQCTQQGADGVWKKTASWEVSKQIERDDTLFGLEQLDSGATSLEVRLQALIEPLLKDYLGRYGGRSG